MTNHARIAAEEISRWVCSVIVKYDGPISHFDGSNPFEQIIAPHFAQAIAAATAEQTRRAEWAELVAKAGLNEVLRYEAADQTVMLLLNERMVAVAWEVDGVPYLNLDANGLPLETPELRAALEAALNKE
jgi:hypothetical protein